MHRFLFGILTLLCVVSCKREFDLPSLDIDITAPFFTTSIEPWDIIPDSLLEGDTLLKLVYQKTLFEVNPDLFFTTGDSLTYISLKVPVAVTYQPGSTFYHNSIEKNMNFGDARITRFKPDKGNIVLEITNTIKERIILQYVVPGANKNGQVFTHSVVVPAAKGQQSKIKVVLDISGYWFDMQGLSGNKYNRVVSLLTGTVHPDGSPALFTASDSLSIFAYFEELSIAEVRGYFGSATISENSQTHLGVFEMFKKGVSTKNISSHISIENGMGMDAMLTLEKMLAINSNSQRTISLLHAIIGNRLNISRATETPGMSTPVRPTWQTYDLSTGNITEMLELLPDFLHYSYNGSTNPLGNVSSGNDFYYKGYPFRGIFNLEVPLNISMNRLKLAEYATVELEKKNNYMNSGLFSLKAVNSFPFELRVNLLLCGKDSIVFDTLLHKAMINRCSFEVSQAMPKTTFLQFPVNAALMQSFYRSKIVLVEVYLNTPSGTINSTISTEQKLIISLSGDVNFHID